jgi:TctA family transporter
MNPCTLAVVRDVFPQSLVVWVFGLTAIVVAGLFIYRARRSRESIQPLSLVFGATLALTLAAPRMKDYSYVLLFLPTVLSLLIISEKRRPAAWGLALLVFAGSLGYQSLLIAALLYIWWLWTAYSQITAPNCMMRDSLPPPSQHPR